MMGVYLFIVLLLLLLNGFFTMAEFAIVKVRPTQIEALAAKGSSKAAKVEAIQARLDEFLSVCQVGITFASIGLGFVGEPAFVHLLEPAVKAIGIEGIARTVTANAIAVALAYLLVSFLHIVIGELLPKSIAIRRTESAALRTALPLMIFRYIFLAPIWTLNAAVNLLLRLLRLPQVVPHGAHSEEEIKIILDQSQTTGMLSFRSLLAIENVLDMGALTVRNAMRPRRLVRVLTLRDDGGRNEQTVSQYRYSRYPVVGEDPGKPLGFVHIKDVFLARIEGRQAEDLGPFLRPCPVFREQDPLEQRLSEMQRKGTHMAVVLDAAGNWAGIITLEDAIEELIGTIEEEYPTEPTVRLADLLSQQHTLIDVEGDTILSAARNALRRIPPGELPLPIEPIMLSVADRERLGSSYVGRRLAIPHARLSRLTRPMVIVARLKEPIAAPVHGEDINLLFILLTPADTPRIHQILLSHIAGIFESDFLEGRLEGVTTEAELHNVICTAEQVVLA